jgi:hypothetical protein
MKKQLLSKNLLWIALALACPVLAREPIRAVAGFAASRVECPICMNECVSTSMITFCANGHQHCTTCTVQLFDARRPYFPVCPQCRGAATDATKNFVRTVQARTDGPTTPFSTPVAATTPARGRPTRVGQRGSATTADFPASETSRLDSWLSEHRRSRLRDELENLAQRSNDLRRHLAEISARETRCLEELARLNGNPLLRFFSAERRKKLQKWLDYNAVAKRAFQANLNCLDLKFSQAIAELATLDEVAARPSEEGGPSTRGHRSRRTRGRARR